MVKELSKTITLKGRSGEEYKFSLWSFEDFDDIKGTFTGAGLYLFTNRRLSDRGYKHTYIYLGETSDYYTRYNDYHKEECIKNHSSNCIGFYSMPNATEDERKIAEEDLLGNYSFPCNTANN